MCYLVYIHIGKNLPEYIYDSIYQSLLVSQNTKIYVLMDDTCILDFRKKLSRFNINQYTKYTNNFKLNVECVPLSILENNANEKYTNIIKKLPERTIQFRDNFWVSTTSRFFYIRRFMELYKLSSVFHIENDIMIYENLEKIKSTLTNNLYLVKDSPSRVIPSIVYISKLKDISDLVDFMLKSIEINSGFNDMQLLGMYAEEFNSNVKLFDYNFSKNGEYLYDGASIGQYLGGIDPRNIQNYDKMNETERCIVTVNNPTKGFINETCTFKIDSNIKLFKKHLLNETFKQSFNLNIPLHTFYIQNEMNNDKRLLVNTHIHSKQLYQFSSVFDLNISDIITGDRVISLCDFVITTNEIYNYHKNLEYFIKKDQNIIVKDFKNVNNKNLNDIFKNANKKTIKLFIYTHILQQFVEYILPNLYDKLNYVIYLHNSDHGLENGILFEKLNNCKHIIKVYSQNINCEFIENGKFSLLPIGLANSMWGHGDILSLYNTMRSSYYLNKTKNLYININPKTFSYRQTVLNEIENERFNITKTPRPFKEYLEDLSQHYFSLCVRGNGLDCHRSWESYYLGVIPVIINNKYTNMDNHIKYLRSLGLPFFEITSDTLNDYSDDFFNETLYKKIITECGSSIYNLQQLKLNYYITF